jgi:2-polyprenyl-3-methyl-5-hydroxy-6-metoxy-1,4-benzoquinol methylase
MIESFHDQSISSGNGMGQHYTDPDHVVVRRAIDLVKETNAHAVLDVACGRGLVSLALARETEASSITALDINVPAVAELATIASTEKLPITGIVFNAAADGYPKSVASHGSVDIVIAKDVYPFLNPTEGKAMVRNISDVLTPEGWLLITAPSTRSRLYRESEPTESPLYRKIDTPAKEYIQTDLDYFTFTSIENMAQVMREAGIEMTEAHHYGRVHGWILAVGQKTAVGNDHAAGVSDAKS